MSTNLEKEIARLDIRQQPVDGLEIAPGCVRTSGGFVVRTPKSKLKLNNFPWRVSAIEQESELLIDPKSLTTPLTRIERENKEVRIPQGDSKPKRE